MSHNTLLNLGYASKVIDGKFRGYELLLRGKEYLDSKREFMDYVLEGGFSYEDVAQAMSKATKVKRKLTKLDENVMISEGRAKAVPSRVYERSASLRNRAIERFTDGKGHIPCMACGFDFFDAYGAQGQGYIEIHHEKPVFQYEEDSTSKTLKQALENLRALCANCHRMVHRKRSAPLSLTQLKALIGLHCGHRE